jgi:hypothetical protein
VVPNDTVKSASLTIHYAPVQAVQLSLQLKHEVRAADPTLAYASNVALLSATLSF